MAHFIGRLCHPSDWHKFNGDTDHHAASYQYTDEYAAANSHTDADKYVRPAGSHTDAHGDSPTAGGHPTAVSEVIFSDGFESGSFSAWSATGGNTARISVTSGGAQGTSTYKMQGRISGTSGYVQDNTPAKAPIMPASTLTQTG